ncbi:tetratricopeptide repeat protein [Methanofollis fontis]|uniref:Tetratricopeptide repeat protein n=1 Tax=Methanofollis fontis TaxID=2052832 RepID=A0A483CQR0_9EURY|nr:tetratricopeptide repeat protein [Methanofollis fontis]TAJ44511.1 hypothetical protein CUJ86_04105 [Methanofollis fontis]
MIHDPSADFRREALTLYEAGKYPESIEVCSRAPDDPSLSILVARNLFMMGKADEAEAHLRDLLRNLPDSSYIHSFLGRVLAARGDGGAIAEYAEAIRLDPSNEEALRAYSEYFCEKKDHISAIPLLRALARLSRKREDASALMRALIETGDGEGALSIHAELLGGENAEAERIDALMVAGRHRDAASASIAAFRKRCDPSFLRQYLAAISAFDRQGALRLFPRFLKDCSDEDLVFDYVLLLKAEGQYREALDLCEPLIARCPDPIYKLVACELIRDMGRTDLAQEGYEGLIREEIDRVEDPETLSMVIGAYETFLRRECSCSSVPECYLDTVSSSTNTVSLIRTGLFYASFGQSDEAKEWLYRAYRLDFLNGGIEYARFCAEEGDRRECEKVLLHILGTIRKSEDIERVAGVVIDAGADWQGMRRLFDALIDRFSGMLDSLSPAGMEVFSRIYLQAAEGALSLGDYSRCKECCLRGLDLTKRDLAPFFDLITRCKQETVAERPVIAPSRTKPASSAATPAEEKPDPGLDEQEEALVAFLRQHRETSEEELRKVLSTRRVSRIANSVIRKAADAGVTLIEKRGMGENGEIYGYIGK